MLLVAIRLWLPYEGSRLMPPMARSMSSDLEESEMLCSRKGRCRGRGCSVDVCLEAGDWTRLRTRLWREIPKV